MDKEIKLTITPDLQDLADTIISDYLDDNDVQVDYLEHSFATTPQALTLYLKQAMEYSGIIGYFYDHMDLFKALFIRYPELLTQVED